MRVFRNGLGTFRGVLQIFANGLGKQPAAPGVTEDMILRFRSARAAQLAAEGQTDASKSAAHASRGVLEIQLMKNLLTVALDAVDKSGSIKTWALRWARRL